VIVMGVSGSGKSTLARALAGELGWGFLEGDDLQPGANIAAMAAGRPLTDADRAPWLAAICAALDAAEGPHIVTCSALKRRYRDVLRRPGMHFVFLDGSPEQLAERLAGRSGHFMAPELLDSQLADLEPPGPDEALRVPMEAPLETQVRLVMDELS
jgi:gluconokinase